MGIQQGFSLAGRIALVTGGSGPLFGSSISEALAEAGATVVVASRSLDRNLNFAKEMRGRGYDVHGMAVDITEAESIYRLHEQVLTRFGRLDVLVNSAVARVGGGLETQTVNDWIHSARGDMVGLFVMCKSFLGDMVRQGKGSIINISSIYGEGVLTSVRGWATVLRPGSDRISLGKSHAKGEPSRRDDITSSSKENSEAVRGFLNKNGQASPL